MNEKQNNQMTEEEFEEMIEIKKDQLESAFSSYYYSKELYEETGSDAHKKDMERNLEIYNEIYSEICALEKWGQLVYVG